MRTVSVNIYKFDELSEEIQEALIEQALAEFDLNDDIEEFMDSKLGQMGLKSLHVESFSIGVEDVDDHVYLSGELSDNLSYFEKSKASEHLNLVSKAFVSSDDVTDDNQIGLSVFFKEGIDEETDETAKLVIQSLMESLTSAEEQLIEEAQEFYEKKSESLATKAKKKLLENEYFADGTLFDEDLMSEN